MKHILFMNDKTPVCENPARLDTFDSPVIVEDLLAIEKSCPDCNAALITHNKKAFEDELTYDYNFRTHREDPLAPARGIMWALAISAPFYLVLALLVWWFFFRG